MIEYLPRFQWWVWALGLIVIFLIFFMWIWALIDCLTSRLPTTEKLFWFLIILFFNFLGALLYFIFESAVSRKGASGKRRTGKRLFRSKKNRIIAGVCGGVGKYLGVDPTAVRLILIILILVSLGTAILAYILAWIIIPRER